MQDSNTADMIFDAATLVAILPEAMTLEPGDVSEIEIEGIGILANRIARRGPAAR